ncbi:hypothetical protein ABIC60_004902 [Phyllobacterium ifriqiyense]
MLNLAELLLARFDQQLLCTLFGFHCENGCGSTSGGLNFNKSLLEHFRWLRPQAWINSAVSAAARSSQWLFPIWLLETVPLGSRQNTLEITETLLLDGTGQRQKSTATLCKACVSLSMMEPGTTRLGRGAGHRRRPDQARQGYCDEPVRSGTHCRHNLYGPCEGPENHR